MILDFLSFKSQNDAKISMLKSISWRIVGTLDTILISFILTGKISLALSIGGVEVLTKMTLYYFHERAWIKLTKNFNGSK